MHEKEREKKRKREREKEARKRRRIGLFCQRKSRWAYTGFHQQIIPSFAGKPKAYFGSVKTKS